MAKVLRCRDVGMDCDFIARADSEEELLKKAAEHAAKTHVLPPIKSGPIWSGEVDPLVNCMF